ncbi:MAG: anaerobic ribonucleoside-triphosphate reductase activating protein [Planctomycetota bacterium]
MLKDEEELVPRQFPPIRGFIENTLIDWEGKIACEVFLPTCNLRCPFCHAAHLLTNDGELEPVPVSAVTDCLDRHKGWLDGVVISGGEPTLHETLPALIDELRSHGAMIKLDTNGTRPEVIEGLLARGLLDAISMDIKTALDERYSAAAGCECDVDAIRRSAKIIMGSGVEYEFRTTVCPAFHRLKELRDIAEAIRGADKYVLQQFKPGECLDPAMDDVTPYPREKLRTFAAELREYVKLCIVRGDWPVGQAGGYP